MQLRGMCVGVVAAVAALAPAVAPAHAQAASPVLEYVAPGAAFPIPFTAEGGAVTAELAGYNTVVLCADSEGDGVITGPRSTKSDYVFTGCETQGGSGGGSECQSDGASAKEIKSEEIDAELVYIDQAKHKVGMLLNPDEGVYMEFECGGEDVKALGDFLSPVGPINVETTSFSAILTRSGALQTPNEYENADGATLQAIPMGERNEQPPVTTGVGLSFTIEPDVPLEIRAVTAAEVEAEQREEESRAAKKRQDEEAAAAAAKKRQEDEAAAAGAVGRRQEEEAKLERLRRTLLSSSLKQCRKAPSKHKRVRCVKRAKKTYGSPKPR